VPFNNVPNYITKEGQIYLQQPAVTLDMRRVNGKDIIKEPCEFMTNVNITIYRFP